MIFHSGFENDFTGWSNYNSATCEIVADSAPVGRAFDCWLGDTGALADPNAADTTILMPANDVTVTARYVDAEQYIDIQISASDQDAEETSGGVMLLSNPFLMFTSDVGMAFSGLHFDNIAIPQGAIITEAYIQYTSAQNNSEATNLVIRAHDISDAPAFVSTANNLSNRTLTSASAAWPVELWTSGSSGSAERTTDFSNVIGEVVSRTDWSSGNDLAIILSGTGCRRAEARAISDDGTITGAGLYDGVEKAFIFTPSHN